jgi:hypothetical protein
MRASGASVRPRAVVLVQRSDVEQPADGQHLRAEADVSVALISGTYWPTASHDPQRVVTAVAVRVFSARAARYTVKPTASIMARTTPYRRSKCLNFQRWNQPGW